MEKTKEKKYVMHFSEMLHLLSIAEERRQTVDILAWKSNGEINHYNGWYVHHDYWRGGYVKLRNPVNNQVRLVPEIYIFEINKYKVYL